MLKPGLRRLNLPNGRPASDDMDRIMLLNMWGKFWEQETGEKVEFAHMGKPTHPINLEICKAIVAYWERIEQEEQRLLELMARPEDLIPFFNEKIAREQDVDPQGDFECRQLIANGFNNFSHPAVQIKPEHIVLTMGGAAGSICVILETLDEQDPDGWALTPDLHYSLHAQLDKTEFFNTRQTNLSMEESLDQKLDEMEQQGRPVKVVILANPSNPTGAILTRAARQRVGEIVKKHNCYLIVDEAYAQIIFKKELCLSDILNMKAGEAPRVSNPSPMLNAIDREDSELLNRCIFIRTSSKADADSGERLPGAAIVFEPELRSQIVEKNKFVGIVPLFLQVGLAASVNSLQDEYHPNLQEKATSQEEERFSVGDFYQGGVELVEKETTVSHMNWGNKVGGTFYVCANLSFLINFKIEEEYEKLLRRVGIELIDGKLDTDEACVYYILFKYWTTVAPLSCYGGDPYEGSVRITCASYDASLAQTVKIFIGLKSLIETGLSNTDLHSSNHHASESIRSVSALKHELSCVSKISDKIAVVSKENISLSTSFASDLKEDWLGWQRKAEEALQLNRQYQCARSAYIAQLLRTTLQGIIETIFNFPPVEQVSVEQLESLESTVYSLLINTMPKPEKNVLVLEKTKEKEIKQFLRENLFYHVAKIKDIKRACQTEALVFNRVLFEEIINSLQESLSQHDPVGVSPYFCFWYKRQIKAYDDVHYSALKHQLISLKASIDYEHPQGNLECRKTIRDALRKSYSSSYYDYHHLQEDDLLLTCDNPEAVFKPVFSVICDLKHVKDFEKIFRDDPEGLKKYAVIARNAQEYLGQGLKKEALETILMQIKDLLSKFPNVFIIIDESFLEECFHGTFTLAENSIWGPLLDDLLNEQGGESAIQRLVLVRSSIPFSSPKAIVSVIGTSNKTLMPGLLARNIRMSGHAIRSLQFAYASHLERFTSNEVYQEAYSRSRAVLSAVRTLLSRSSGTSVPECPTPPSLTSVPRTPPLMLSPPAKLAAGGSPVPAKQPALSVPATPPLMLSPPAKLVAGGSPVPPKSPAPSVPGNQTPPFSSWIPGTPPFISTPPSHLRGLGLCPMDERTPRGFPRSPQPPLTPPFEALGPPLIPIPLHARNRRNSVGSGRGKSP